MYNRQHARRSGRILRWVPADVAAASLRASEQASRSHDDEEDGGLLRRGLALATPQPENDSSLADGMWGFVPYCLLRRFAAVAMLWYAADEKIRRRLRPRDDVCQKMMSPLQVAFEHSRSSTQNPSQCQMAVSTRRVTSDRGWLLRAINNIKS